MRSRRTTGTAGRHLATGLATLAAFALAALVAGCGDGDDSSSTTASCRPASSPRRTSPSAAERRSVRHFGTRSKPDAPAPDFGETAAAGGRDQGLGRFWAATADQGQDLLDQLSQLQPPADLEKQWDEFLRPVQAAQVDFADDLQTTPRPATARSSFETRSIAEIADRPRSLGPGARHDGLRRE